MRKVWFEDDYEIRLLRRGKRRLLDIVFGRTMVIVVLLLGGVIAILAMCLVQMSRSSDTQISRRDGDDK